MLRVSLLGEQVIAVAATGCRTKDYWEELHPTAGRAYVNFTMDEGQDRGRAPPALRSGGRRGGAASP